MAAFCLTRRGRNRLAEVEEVVSSHSSGAEEVARDSQLERALSVWTLLCAVLEEGSK